MRKTIVAAAVALSAVAGGLVVIAAGRPAVAAVGDVPADCKHSVAAYRSDGQRLHYRYAERKTATESMAGDKLSWVPTGLVTFGSVGDDTSRADQNLATHPTDGHIYLVKRVAELVNGVWKITEHTVTRGPSGFAGTRSLTSAWPYIYRATATSLYRTKVSFSNGRPTFSTPVQIPGTAWGSVRTLSYQRTVGTGTAAVDVLRGTKANGELKEWRINHATPVKVSSKVLKPSGWAAFTTLSTGYCDSQPKGRLLFGITAAGSASAFFDADATDGVGTDIKGGSLGDLGWTEKAYSR